MSTVLYIAGTEASTRGIWVSGVATDWLSAPRASFEVSSLTDRIGGIVSRTYDVAPRRLVVPIRVDHQTLSDRRDAEDWLKGMFTREVVVRLDDETTPARQIRGVMDGIALEPVARMLSPVSRGSISLICGDPLWQEIDVTDLALEDDEEAIALGNAPVHQWALTITGTLTDPTVTIRNGDGATLATLAWTGSTGGDDLVIDASTGRVLLDGDTAAFADYTGGFPVLDPYDEPTIQLGAASGTPAGTLSLRKRFW